MKKNVIEKISRDFGGSPGREVRVITPDLIDEYLTIYLNAYPAYKDLSDESIAGYRNKYLNSMQNDENITFVGLFEEGEFIALMKLIDFSMNIFGKMGHAAGLMSLAVSPMHKKKGAGLDMVRFFEKYTKETKATVAMLLPFRIDFYRNMGYGYGGRMDEYRIPTSNLPKCSDTSKIKFLGLEDTKAMLRCQADFASRNHGMVVKFEDEIRAMTSDSQSKRIGFIEDGQLKGYAVYDFVSESEVNYTLNRIEVSELVYLSPAVLRAFLGFFRNQSDLAENIVIRTGEEDFYHILPSAQDISGNYIDFGFLQTNVSAVGTMYKIVDLANFVETCGHREFPAADLTVAFDFYDELAHRSESFSVSFKTEPGEKISRWHEASPGAVCDVHIKCSLADISSLFMGSCRLSSLVRLGSVQLSDPSYEALIDSLFYCSQKPWTNTDY